ncbi:hypothetical protein FOMPIDRAFT_1029825 [Fomitopsis schrenkii]|uniref:SHSP domain-containing protein n=1 Tax=Fomitopsis schrenkii TaxID=2126942 RepID=S8E9B8_FOMSC|nr:hypothetical protein FOMPIDRAFT_1029825 [Fomitopsis schrenkii]
MPHKTGRNVLTSYYRGRVAPSTHPPPKTDRLLDELLSARNVSNRSCVRTAHAWPVEATCELPGVIKEDVNIDVNNNRVRLTVPGESRRSMERDENGYAKFSRTLQLPTGILIILTATRSSVENGLLTVTFRRVMPEQGPEKITFS